MAGGYGSNQFGAGSFGSSSGLLALDLLSEVLTLTESLDVQGGQYGSVSPGGWGQGWGGFWGGTYSGASNPSELDAEVLTLAESIMTQVPLRLLSASSVSTVFVQATFSAPLDPFDPDVTNPLSYVITPGLTVLAVSIADPYRVLLLTTPQEPGQYTLTVSHLNSIYGDELKPGATSYTFSGFGENPAFRVTAQSKRKVAVKFSTAMTQNAAYALASNYGVTSSRGAAVSVGSVTVINDQLVQLNLLADLTSDVYYAVRVEPAVVSADGLPSSPDTALLFWRSQKSSIRIPLDQFSGEVSGGILGTPAGQVFISPALEQGVQNSTIEIDSVSVSTRADDVYLFPVVPDPQVLYTWPTAGSTLTTGCVTFAKADRLGLARMDLSDHRSETFPIPQDSSVQATLVETHDQARVSLTNNSTWRLFYGSGTAFATASNLTPIGPGSTQNLTLG